METAEQEKEHAKRFFKFLEGGMVEIRICENNVKEVLKQEKSAFGRYNMLFV